MEKHFLFVKNLNDQTGFEISRLFQVYSAEQHQSGYVTYHMLQLHVQHSQDHNLYLWYNISYSIEQASSHLYSYRFGRGLVLLGKLKRIIPLDEYIYNNWEKLC